MTALVKRNSKHTHAHTQWSECVQLGGSALGSPLGCWRCRGSRHVSNLAAVPWAHPSGWPAPRSRDAEASALRQWVLGSPLSCRALDSPSGLPAPRSRDASASALGQWVLDVGTPAGGAPLGAPTRGRRAKRGAPSSVGAPSAREAQICRRQGVPRANAGEARQGGPQRPGSSTGVLHEPAICRRVALGRSPSLSHASHLTAFERRKVYFSLFQGKRCEARMPINVNASIENWSYLP